MQPKDAFNSLTDKVLGSDLSALGDPDTFLTAAVPVPVAVPSLEALQGYTNELNSLSMKLYGKARAALPSVAWRCKVCNRVNGVASNGVKPRKTCSKCARPRNNELTLKQEYAVRILINDGMDEHKAVEQVTEGEYSF